MHTDISHEIQSELQEINQNEIFKLWAMPKQEEDVGKKNN